MKHIAIGLLVYAVAPALAVAADDESGDTLTVNLTLTSDYRFRGHSQTDGDAAVQGGADYTHKSGLFVGFWASSIDFDNIAQSPVEIDFTAGYGQPLGYNTDGSIWLAYYWYPDSEPADYDYVEVLANVRHDFGVLAITGDATWSPDYSGSTGDALGLSVGAQVPVTWDEIDWLTVSGSFGRQWIEDNATYGTPDWYFYDIGATANWGIFAFDLRYVDTDLDHLECFGGTELCSAGVVLTLTATLPVIDG